MITLHRGFDDILLNVGTVSVAAGRFFSVR
jgi:hypothetical protein